MRPVQTQPSRPGVGPFEGRPAFNDPRRGGAAVGPENTLPVRGGPQNFGLPQENPQVIPGSTKTRPVSMLNPGYMRAGGKVKKMADGGSAGEMQAFMKGRRDARSSMAPKAPMAPKASMAAKAPMASKARMASKAPMAPKASMSFMKSGGAVKSKSRGNGCAARGHTRGRMV